VRSELYYIELDSSQGYLIYQIKMIKYNIALRPAPEYFTGRDVTIAGEGQQNLGLCSALRAFEQGGIFIVPHLL
jgi:hypothetical protein